ncbi:MAG TPA: GNAT family N-acetyltransferase [Acidimicrobiales bacterium]|nr:GNAT family N-acetyltransferase [Acidimicrobiales bacterium]
MSAPSPQVIRWGAERARCTPWRGDGSLAHLAPASDSQILSTGFVRHCLGRLAGQGYAGVVTSALAPPEQAGFIDAGFGVEQRLHLLAHDLSVLPDPDAPEGVRLRRTRHHDMGAVVGIDRSAFDEFWTMDADALKEATEATPRARFRLALAEDEAQPAGYAITGKAGNRGYLQRLAVSREMTGRGIGRWLVSDGLRWLKRWGAERCLVNTQEGNQRALDLYERMGFRLQNEGLAVLGTRLGQ